MRHEIDRCDACKPSNPDRSHAIASLDRRRQRFEVADRLVADNARNVVLISADGEREFADVLATSPALGFISKADLSADAIADVLDRGRSPSND